jgi:ADP-ribosylglycohydrolase
MTSANKISGCLFGLALGDAHGAPTEFLPYREILARWPLTEPWTLEGDPIRVTDDTQMTLAVADALVNCKSAGGFTPSKVEEFLRQAFVEWLNSPDNNRAPGITCIGACSRLEAGEPWFDATVADSKGCGANMRVAPVGLVQIGQSPLSERDLAAIAQFQAAMTHGHPTALAASDLTAWAVRYLCEGGEPDSIVRAMREYAESARRVYHERWLGTLWQRPAEKSPESFIERGWLECLRVLDRLESALGSLDYSSDPCLATGAGWVAEEALATGLLCFLMYPQRPQQALRFAAATSGDSDSIACLTGAFAGAYHGFEAWPEEWVERIEYRDRLRVIAASLSV